MKRAKKSLDQQVDQVKNVVSSDVSNTPKSGIKKDLFNIIFLMFLYVIQCVPLGLCGSLPYILSARKVSYSDQGTFSFVFWPFSLKLLWAPLVDSLYFKHFGRRKSWLVPVQYLIGVYMIYVSDFVKDVLDNDKLHNNGSDSIFTLTLIFLVLSILAATQDISVDGWALTMLSKENVSWSSTCESVGGTLGWFIGNVLFLVIESSDFSNTYIRSYLGLENQPYGIVTIKGFMSFFGIVYLVTTTLVLFFKKEGDYEQEEDSSLDYSLLDTYKLIWKILSLKPILKLIFVLVTMRIAFASEQMAFLKLIDAGVPKEKLGLLAVPLAPLQIILPFYISKKLSQSSPFTFHNYSFLLRLVVFAASALWASTTPLWKSSDGSYPLTYFLICVILEAFQSVAMYAIFIPMSIFCNNITDKNIGATYITFLNTARSFTNTATLYFANFITFKDCKFEIDQFGQRYSNSSDFDSLLDDMNVNDCGSKSLSKICEEHGGTCDTLFDAFYPLTAFGVVFGIFWLIKINKMLIQLQELPKSSWKIHLNKIKLKR